MMITEPGFSEPVRSTLGRTRAIVIVTVAVLAIGIGITLGSVLVGRGASPLSGAATYVPAEAVMYFEARLDLSPAQRASLREILLRFPGVDPDDLLTDALAETLDAALADAYAPFDYSNDVAPWFDGTLAVALLDYPLSSDPAEPALPGMVAFFGVRDAGAAETLAETLRGELEASGSAFSSADHSGVTVWSAEVEPDPYMPIEGLGFAYAVTDDQLILANGEAQVVAALDAPNGETLAGNAEVARLLGSLPDDRAGVAVMNAAAMLAELRAELEAADPALAAALAGYLDDAPALSVASVSFAEDALLMDQASDRPEGVLAGENGSRGLAERVPADAIFFADSPNLGATLAQTMVAVEAGLALGPMGGEQTAMLEQVEAALGAELDEFVSWIGDGAMAAGWDGSEPYLGLLLRATDPDAAARRLNQLGALAELAASESSSGVSVESETVHGVEVTTIRFGDHGEAIGLQFALDGDLALLGFGERFVEAALTIDQADSLAGNDGYRAAMERFGGAENAGAVFLDLTALREAVESAFPVDSVMREYVAVRPYLEPFDYVAGVSRVEGDRLVTRMGLVLR